MFRKRNMEDLSCDPQSIDISSISLEIRQICRDNPSRRNLSACAPLIRASAILSRLLAKGDFTILYIVRKFYPDGRMNVANTFCDSYHAIPRPFGNAKIDFPENYVREPAQVLRRTQRHTLLSRIRTRGRIRTRFSH